mgnify:FL=1
MEESYSIDEILIAVNDFQNNKKEKKITIQSNTTNIKIKSDIPKDTLRLIEEAEKRKKN